MASRKEPQLHEPINLDDLFHVPLHDDSGHGRPSPIITGLSEEEDAARYISLRFNPTLLSCPNCEVVIDHGLEHLKQEAAVVIVFCPRCNGKLAPVGTPPRRRKHT